MILKDSIAQTFILTTDRFLSNINLYFSKVDPNDNISVEIRNTVNGYPGEIIYGTKLLVNTDINISSDGTKSTNVNFGQLIFIEKEKFYSIVISGISKNTRLWISRIGNNILNTNKTVEEQPSKGSLFTSQNGITWTAQQTDDLKYEIYTAKFKSSIGTIALKSSQRNFIKLGNLPFEAEAGSSLIRVYCLNHGLNPLDKVNFKMFSTSTKIKITVDGNIPVVTTNSTPTTTVTTNSKSFALGLMTTVDKPPVSTVQQAAITNIANMPTVGQIITTGTGKAKIKSISFCNSCPSNKTYTVFLDFISGYFEGGQTFSTDIISDSFSPFYTVIEGEKSFVKPSITGIINDSVNLSINGITQDKFFKDTGIVVQSVDSVDSFIIDVGTNAIETGRFGPNDVELLCNYKYDVFNVNGNQALFGTTCNWLFNGKIHGQTSGPLSTKHKADLSNKQIILNNDMYLEEPLNYFSSLNYSGSSIKVKGVFDSGSIYNTPVFDLDSFSTILISNHIDYSFLSKNVAPNASNRFIAETDPVNGTAVYKYVTKTVTLKNPADDLRILLDVYQPEEADFKLYIKKMTSADSRRIDEIDWVELGGFTKPINNSKYLTDKIEIDFVTSDAGITGWDNLSFSLFKFKIVGTSTNSCKAPLFSNLRILAIT